jgi:2-polyprenyl-6-methoxyphenol hydroxylase-like FAD-dependent oxidoreductase
MKRRIFGTMNPPRRALIIGGGIAGPALSLFLARAGIEPVVLEAYPRADDVGSAFQIAPNGLRVLAELGLGDALLAAGAPSRDFCFRNHHGRTIGVAHTGSAGPAVNVARAAVQRGLREEVERRGIAIHHEKRLRDIAIEGPRITAIFEDGSRETGDLLIGADGVHSRVRAWMLPEHARPRDTGMVSIGGLCASDAAAPPDPEDADRLTFLVGPKHQFGYSKMSPSRWGWWCHVGDGDAAEAGDLITLPGEALRARMQARYAGWCAPTQALIASTETWLRTRIHDVPKLPTWHRGPVVLIGDAAHAMSPAGGQGASLALEDARLLAQLLGSGERSIEDALTRFEALRKKRAEAMVAQGYANDRRSLNELGATGQWMRDRVIFPLLAPMMARALTRVYSARLGDPAPG